MFGVVYLVVGLIGFAVTGFDDIPEAAMGIPPLTTMNADPRARGRQAADLLLQRASDPSPLPRQEIVRVELTRRESTPHVSVAGPAESFAPATH